MNARGFKYLNTRRCKRENEKTISVVEDETDNVPLQNFSHHQSRMDGPQRMDSYSTDEAEPTTYNFSTTDQQSHPTNHDTGQRLLSSDISETLIGGKSCDIDIIESPNGHTEMYKTKYDHYPFSYVEGIAISFSILFYLADIVTDALLAEEYYSHDRIGEFAATTFFILFPAIVTSTISMIWFCQDRDEKSDFYSTKWICKFTFTLLPTAPIVRYVIMINLFISTLTSVPSTILVLLV